jgi:GntR family transcriptional regulator, histidine utilization repressor
MTPLYAQVKDHILSNIQSGVWPVGMRVPSENELVESFKISRMTANRALRELANGGYVARVPGVGTFVKEQAACTSLLELHEIAEEIASRGHTHSARIELLKETQSTPALDDELAFKSARPLFHMRIVHFENAAPVQIEDRHVNAELIPNFAAQDFNKTTPTADLLATIPVDEIEHTVEARLPDATQQRLLNIKSTEPCLALLRRSWSRGHVVTVASLIYPASRYALYSRYKTNAQGNPS